MSMTADAGSNTSPVQSACCRSVRLAVLRAIIEASYGTLPWPSACCLFLEFWFDKDCVPGHATMPYGLLIATSATQISSMRATARYHAIRAVVCFDVLGRQSLRVGTRYHALRAVVCFEELGRKSLRVGTRYYALRAAVCFETLGREYLRVGTRYHAPWAVSC